jgi:hypothetical protein
MGFDIVIALIGTLIAGTSTLVAGKFLSRGQKNIYQTKILKPRL